jgi:UDP-glucose:(heptosyl)LPS alpha-1,3-glucosyltransferase
VDANRFCPNPDWRDRLRQEGGIDADEVVALFVGGDWDHKGLEVAIKGLAIAQDLGANVRLWVVGRGQRNRFHHLARQVGVVGKVSFFGVREDVEMFYAAADIFVLPTVYETFSLVAHEAAACRLPIVATRVSGIEDLVGDDKAGFLVQRGSEAVGEALARLAADKELRETMGAEGQHRVIGSTWERSAASVVDLYGTLLRAKSSSRFEAEGLPR